MSVAPTPLTEKLVGATVSQRDEVDGYVFWGLVAVVGALLVVLFHLALYPWPNYNFGGP